MKTHNIDAVDSESYEQDIKEKDSCLEKDNARILDTHNILTL